MGVITDLIRRNHEEKLKDAMKQIAGYRAILDQPDEKVPQNTKEWAIDNIMALTGMGGGSKGKDGGKQNPLKMMLHGLSNLNPRPGAAKPVGTPEQPTGHFLASPEQQAQAREQESQQAAKRAGEILKAQEVERLLKEKQQREEEMQDAIQQRNVNHSLIEASPYLTEEQKRKAHTGYDDKFFGLGLRPANLKFTEVTTIDGKKMPVWEDQQSGQFLTLDHQPVNPATIQSGPSKTSVAQTKEEIAWAAWGEKHGIPVEKMTASQKLEAQKEAEDKPSGELKTRTEAQSIIDNPKGHTPSEIQAAKDTIKHLNAAERGIEVRLGKSLQGEGKESDISGYVPGGASKINPKKDPIIDTMAVEFITTGHLPFVGLGGGKGAANKRERAVGRASEILADYGLTPFDLPAIRAGVKGGTAAIGRVATLGALVQQFENTVERNMETARALDKKFSRTSLPWVNRVVAAWKTGTGDPEAVNFVAQMHALANEWAKVMQGAASAAGATVSSTQDAERIMSPYLASGQVESLFTNVILPDMRNRSRAIEDEKTALGQQLRNIVTQTSVTPPSPQLENRIKVKRKSDGKKGTIEEKDFDPKTYEKVP